MALVMEQQKSLTCIVCPFGCKVQVQLNWQGGVNEVRGYQCKRGKEYAAEEAVNPTRIVASTVVIKNAHLNRLPVKTSKPISIELIMPCMDRLDKVVVNAPIKEGDIIINDVLNTGIDIVATRSIPV